VVGRASRVTGRRVSQDPGDSCDGLVE
jgi:hypothetical protein